MKNNLRINNQENKNDRGDLEQPQPVNCGSQALTNPSPVSPIQPQVLPLQRRHNLPTNNSLQQLPIAPTRSYTCDDTENFSNQQLILGGEGSLAHVVEQLEEEARYSPEISQKKPWTLREISRPAYLDLNIDGHKTTASTAIQTDADNTSTDLEEHHAEYKFTSDISDLLSHLSERDDEDDDKFSKAQTEYGPDSPKLHTILSVEDDEFTRASSTENDTKQMKDQPTKGMVYYIIHTVLMSGNMYAAQQLFKAADTVAIMQLTFVRGVVCSLMVLLMINRNAKQILWDPVDRRTLPSLIFRCLQGGISVYIAFSSINYFNVSTVGIVCSLKPIIACIFGVTILNEPMSCKDVVCMSAVFIAVFLVIFGSKGSQQEAMQSNPWAMVALVAQPFLLAGGDIAMRKMRKMPEQLCSAYQNLSLSLLACIYMFASGLSFDFIWTLSSQAWLYLCLSCSLTILTQLAKANAFKYSESSRLQKLSFLPNVWQFSIDLIILSVAFSTMQLTGFSLLVTFYICDATYSVVERRMANKKEFQCNDDGYQRL